MKLLFIDPVCFPAHLNFNRLHIDAIKKTGAHIDYVLKKSYAEKLGLVTSNVVYTVPEDICINGSVSYRLSQLFLFRDIKKKLKLGEYDRILISYYDEISLFFADFPRSFLINHINVSGLYNKVKFWFYRKISKRHIQIVLEHYIKNYLEGLGVSNVICIRHGLIDPYEESELPEFYKQFAHLIFSPSEVSSDKEMLQTLINSKEIHDILIAHNIALIIRSKEIVSDCHNIFILSDYISDQLYRSIFTNSKAILITYPKSYKYRTSGVLLEAISCRKYALLSDIDILRQYASVFGKNAFFSDTASFVCSLKYILNSIGNNLVLTDKQITELMPDYSIISNYNLN